MPHRAMSRPEKVAFLEDCLSARVGHGLELGPSISPIFRKSRGFEVKYLESVGTQELQERAKSKNVDPKMVEPIDYILDRNRELSEMVSDSAPFDYVVSSHVIEHIPNPIHHLKEVESILKEGGAYGLFVPDRNLCFDCMRPLSTLGQLIEAHVENRQVASLAARIDEVRYGAKLSSNGHGNWHEADSRDVTSKYPDALTRINVLTNYPKARATAWFGHQWVFSPASFLSIFYDLQRLSLTKLSLKAIKPTGHMDFIVALVKSSKGLSMPQAQELIKDYAPNPVRTLDAAFPLDLSAV